MKCNYNYHTTTIKDVISKCNASIEKHIYDILKLSDSEKTDITQFFESKDFCNVEIFKNVNFVLIDCFVSIALRTPNNVACDYITNVRIDYREGLVEPDSGYAITFGCNFFQVKGRLYDGDIVCTNFTYLKDFINYALNDVSEQA